jgi:hypothetical protein
MPVYSFFGLSCCPCYLLIPLKGGQTNAGTVYYRKVNCKAEEANGLNKGNMKKSAVYNS